jgi:hypothetical protein
MTPLGRHRGPCGVRGVAAMDHAGSTSVAVECGPAGCKEAANKTATCQSIGAVLTAAFWAFTMKHPWPAAATRVLLGEPEDFGGCELRLRP